MLSQIWFSRNIGGFRQVLPGREYCFWKDAMDRFVSNTVNKVDKKGRVSIPAAFRPKLGTTSRIFALLSVDNPCVDAGNEELLAHREEHLATLNPFSEEYEYCSFVLHGESSEMKIDAEGRIVMSDLIREHTGIENEAVFVGRGNFFQIWEPGKFQAYRSRARRKYAQMRRSGFRGREGQADNQEGQSE